MWPVTEMRTVIMSILSLFCYEYIRVCVHVYVYIDVDIFVFFSFLLPYKMYWVYIMEFKYC